MISTIRNTLLAGSAALVLSTGIAAAAPATARADLNVRSGPGTQYPVVGALQSGEPVDVGSCSGSWCQVSFSSGSGFANRSYLALAGGAPSVGVAVAPGYTYDDYPGYAYGDDYDYGYTYGPSVGFYAGSRFHRGWRGHDGWNASHTGNWQGRPGWTGARTGNWQGRTGGGRVGGGAFNQPGRAPQVSAPAGMRGGGAAAGSGFNPGGAAVGAHGTAAQFGSGRR
jgi:hypothetical protein